MKNQHAFLALSLLLSISLTAQSPFKTVPEFPRPTTPVDLRTLRVNPELLRNAVPPANAPLSRLADVRFDLNRLNVAPLPSAVGVKVTADPATGQVFHFAGRPADLKKHTPDLEDARAYLRAVARELHLTDPDAEIAFAEPVTDELGQTHLRFGQRYRGLPVEPADAYLHATNSAGFDAFLGRLQPTPEGLDVMPAKTTAAVLAAARASYGDQWYALSPQQLEWVGEAQERAELVVFYHESKPHLAYKLELHPNLGTHVTRYVDANTGAKIHERSHICGTAGLHAALPPETARVRNLNGDLVTLNTFSQDGSFFLFDVSRPMFRVENEEAQGVIQTFDAAGQSPLNDDFDANTASSANNTDWSRTAASVHDNAGIAYTYFLDRHERNSIDGIDGTIYSFFNVNNEDGTEMDNAFWGGRAMFYGNGDRGFQSLPRALDVAGHEMTHGVISSTADLVYELQPGAINESMADIFGYLIEGEAGDHRLGEDVVNTQFFRSGALRDMRDPNNGGTRFGDRGWQPAHMNEFVTLPNDDDNDHGGVHVNSGIVNRAFVLFSTTAGIGDTRAERVYYRALTQYLTRSSQFADLRIAVARAARDLFGASAETAANDAFAAVGIGGEAGDYEEDIEVNAGDRFLLLSNPALSELALADESGNLLRDPLTNVNLLSRPSVTDDGSLAFFVDDQNRMRAYDFVNQRLLFVENDPSTIWRNVAVSKDGERLAITTTERDNKIFILDLVSGDFREMTLTNPTTSDIGLNTDNVRFPDIIEWEPGGEFLMYDALNFLDTGIEYWDIGFLRAWDKDRNTFGDGNITKLYSALEPNVSIGNPTFSKNSPYIIAFEERDDLTDRYTIMAANIEQSQANALWENTRIGFPNYGIADDRIVFDGTAANGGERAVGLIMLNDDKITRNGTPNVLLRDRSWGIFFANGDRSLGTSIDGPVVDDARVKVYPTVTSGLLTIEAELTTAVPLQVFDAAGRLVLRTDLNGPVSQVNFSNLASGSYFVAVPVRKGTVIRRVIKR
ncbi:MAG: M4 family metallopeptidase [Bacteroidota bacterium]